MLDHTADAILATDADWKITAWNDAAERLYGWRRDEVFARRGDMILTPSGRQGLEARRERLLAQGRWRGELPVRRKDGSELLIDAVTVILRDRGGRINGYLGIHRDNSGRQAAERTLRYHASLLDTIDDAVVGTDTEFRLTVWNRGAERLYGYGAHEVLGRDARTVASYEGDSSRTELEAELREAGRTRTEITAYRKDGTRVEVELIVGDVRDSAGRIAGYLGVHRDITGRKAAERALREAQAEAEAILESITDVFFAVDREWRYTYLNRLAVDLIVAELGRDVTAEELIGRSCWDTLPDYRGSASYDAFHRAVSEQRALELEDHILRLDRWFEIRLYPSPSGLSVYMRDVTARKRDQEQLAYHASLLENMQDAVLATDTDFVLTAWNRGAETMFGYSAQAVLGRTIDELLPSERSSADAAAARDELIRTGRHREELVHYARGEREVCADALAVALPAADGPRTGYLWILRDSSARRAAERDRERRAAQQAIVADLGLRALAADDIPAFIDEAVALVVRALDVDLASVGELVPDREEVAWVAQWGFESDPVARGIPSPATADSLAGYAVTSGEPVISADVRSDERFKISRLFAGEAPVSAMAVVIQGTRQPFGVIAVATRTERHFGDDDVNFLRTVANVLATLMERLRMETRLEEARENERMRIARDLHDEALGELSGALSEAILVRDGGAAPDRISSLIARLQRVGERVRAAIYDLRLGGDTRTFADLMTNLVSIQAALAGGITVQPVGFEALPGRSLGEFGIEVLRIVGEAMTNARRHSGASVIRVNAAATTPEVLRVAVADDGLWPAHEIEMATPLGAGIPGMQERAALLGASLTIGREATGGTKVAIELSLPSEH
jgi:PAS domain S-box-containing protein